MVYQKCHCAEHLIFSPLTSPFFLRGELFYYHTHALQSSSALSCLLLPCPALPVLLTNLQTEELSQLGAKEGIWVGTAGGKGEERKRGLNCTDNQGGHERKSWDWRGRVRRERAVCWSKLFNPALLNWWKHNRSQEQVPVLHSYPTEFLFSGISYSSWTLSFLKSFTIPFENLVKLLVKSFTRYVKRN